MLLRAGEPALCLFFLFPAFLNSVTLTFRIEILTHGGAIHRRNRAIVFTTAIK
jgi:hypothetical protein